MEWEEIKMNVSGKIKINANDFIFNFEKAGTQKKAGLLRIKKNCEKIKGVSVKLSKKDITIFEKYGEDINNICRETVAETARYCRGEVYRLAYRAPAPYVRLGVTYEPGTLAKRSYAYTLPRSECPKNVHISKVSFLNNAATGWFGEVAVLWEYGSARTPAHPMVRPAMKMAETVFRNGIKWRLSKLKKQFQAA